MSQVRVAELAPVRTPKPQWAGLICLAAAVFALTVPFADHGRVYGPAIVMLFCVIVPVWFRWQRGRFDLFESVHVIGFVYFVFFGLGAILTQSDPSNVAADKYVLQYLPKATLYCLLGYVALLSGYFGPWFRPVPERAVVQNPVGNRFMATLGGLGLAGGLSQVAWRHATDVGASSAWFVSSVAQLEPLFLYAWALGCLLVISGQATPTQKRLFFFAQVPATAMLLSFTLHDKSLTMTLVGVPVMALWYVKRKLPWKSLVILVLALIFVVFPIYNTYRTLDPHLSRGDRASMTYEMATDWDREDYFERSVSTTARRLAMINSVAVVIRDTGRWVPYEYGRTLFLPAVAYFIPRAVWPDKPLFNMGRRFAETFRVVNILDDRTNIAATVPGELYWNFGLAGIVFGMALWGVVVRLGYRRYGESRSLDPVRRAFHLLLLIQFVHFGGGLAAQSVTLIRTVILLEALCWLGRRIGWIAVKPRGASR